MPISNFPVVPNLPIVGANGLPVQVLNPVPNQLFTAAGTITLFAGYIGLGSVGALAMVLPQPDQDGQALLISAQTAQAHTVANATNGFNNKGSAGTITFNGTKGSSVIVVSQNANWWAFALNGVTVA